MKAFGYIRVSTDEQAHEGLSLPAQARAVEAYCAQRGLELAAEYREERSAKNMRRPILRAMLDEAERQGVGAIVVYKLDRLNRNQEDAFEIRKRLRRSNIRIVSVTEPTEMGGAAGKIAFSVTSLFNEILRDQIADITKSTLADIKAQGGKYGHVPYGFRSVPSPARSNGKARFDLVPDESQQEILRHMASLRRTGSSLKAIARHLNVSHIKSPQAAIRAHGHMRSGLWSASTVMRILRRAGEQPEPPR